MDDVVAKGRQRTVIWGSRQARDHFHQLSAQDQAKLLGIFQLLAEMGHVHNDEKFKKLEEGLWEFKSFQQRFLGDHRPGGLFVIALGLKKKKDRHKKKDLERAHSLLGEYDDARR